MQHNIVIKNLSRMLLLYATMLGFTWQLVSSQHTTLNRTQATVIHILTTRESAICESLQKLPRALQKIIIEYITLQEDMITPDAFNNNVHQKLERVVLASNLLVAGLELGTFMYQTYTQDTSSSISNELSPIPYLFFATSTPMFCWNTYQLWRQGLLGIQNPPWITRGNMFKTCHYSSRLYGSAITASLSTSFMLDTLKHKQGAQICRLLGSLFGGSFEVIISLIRC